MLENEEIFVSAWQSLTDSRFAEAEQHARRLLRRKPTHAGALYVLGLSHLERGDDLECIRLLRDALNYDPAFLPGYAQLATTYSGLGLSAQAAAVYREWHAADPSSPEALHMKLATTGGDTPQRCSPEYIRVYFDEFAQTFDDVLGKRLRYRGPELMASTLAKYFDSRNVLPELLDAGCGTGLCGATVRRLCRRLTGVDLSEKMVALARERGCYDQLAVADIADFMMASPRGYDVVISADVLVYFGSLDAVLAAAHRALRPNGLFIATLESGDQIGHDDFILRPTGRYAHTETYLRKVLDAVGFQVVSLNKESLRREGSESVQAFVVVARSCRS